MTTDYRALCAELVAIEDALSGGSVQFSNQGQALDGYSALATFRDVANRARALLAQPVAHIIRTDQDETGPYVLVAQSKSNVPTAAELRQVFLDQSGYVADEQAMLCDDFYAAARAVLAKWGHQ